MPRMKSASGVDRARPPRTLSDEHQKRVADSDSLRATNPNRTGPAMTPAQPKEEETTDVSE